MSPIHGQNSLITSISEDNVSESEEILTYKTIRILLEHMKISYLKNEEKRRAVKRQNPDYYAKKIYNLLCDEPGNYEDLRTGYGARMVDGTLRRRTHLSTLINFFPIDTMAYIRKWSTTVFAAISTSIARSDTKNTANL